MATTIKVTATMLATIAKAKSEATAGSGVLPSTAKKDVLYPAKPFDQDSVMKLTEKQLKQLFHIDGNLYPSYKCVGEAEKEGGRKITVPADFAKGRLAPQTYHFPAFEPVGEPFDIVEG